MKLHRKIKSNIDDSIKYILFTDADNLVVEATFIDKHDGKNIICLPTQTSCCMKCKFCHVTDISEKVILRNLTSEEIISIVNYIFEDLKLSREKMLLISFMGCGEPLLNVENLISGMASLTKQYQKIRFAIATSMPMNIDKNFNYLLNGVIENKLNVKTHLSLHYTNDSDRGEWMPKSETIEKSLENIKLYKEQTSNNVEIHYTLISGVNDRKQDVDFLIEKFKDSGICIKFIRYNSKNTVESEETPIDKAKEIMSILNQNGIQTEYYTPPARDIGGSCGQILTQEYLEHNKNRQ